MTLAIITAHAGADSLKDAVRSWGFPDCGIPSVVSTDVSFADIAGFTSALFVVDGTQGMLAAYQRGFMECKADLLAFFHDDLILKDPDWLPRVMAEFEGCGKCGYLENQHPGGEMIGGAYTRNQYACEKWEQNNVGVVGFCGALVHGSPELYKRPYDYRQLIRSHVLSNMEDAEVHGERFKGSNDAATLDGFALIARRSLLESAGGWPLGKLDYIMYDQWLVCMAHRLGYRVRVVGVACHHLGGRTAVALKRNDDDSGEKYQAAHRFIYDHFRDVLPWRCIKRAVV